MRLPCECGKPAHARGMCRACYHRWLVKANPEFAAKQRDNQERWKARNPERWKLITGRSRDKNQAIERKSALSRKCRKYGLTTEEYRRLITDGCGICKGTERLCIDHCHTTGKFRGILCHSCNIGLGFVERPNGWLEGAREYLRLTNNQANR